jgi:membrane protease YdiL (CAAX protease family)
VLLVTELAVVNVTRSTLVPGGWHGVLGAGMAAGAVLLAVLAGLRTADLGLARATAGRGLRYGAAAFVAVSVVVLALGMFGVLQDDSVDVSAWQMLLRTLVVIPLGTVLVEELTFRGALHGLLRESVSPRWTYALGAVLFGLWHVFPAWRSGATSGAVELGRIPGVAGTFAATTVAGLVFIWLRVRSDSLVAPFLAHTATNSVTFAVAWAVR